MADDGAPDIDVDLSERLDKKTRTDALKEDEAKVPEHTSSGDSTKRNGRAEGGGAGKEKHSKLKEIWGKLGLDAPTLIIMLKGSIAPAIAVAFFQADSVAEIYATLGYLVPIVSVISMPILPRAKYLQTLIFNVIGICIGAAMALLGIWSGVEARKHTTPPGSTASYNSSQSAVCAIWLFFNIYIVNTIRAKVPALQIPVMLYSIFTNVAFTFGPLFATVEQGESLVKRLLIAFLTAFALATGVNVLIFPISCRLVVFKEQAAYLQAIRGALKAQTVYLQSLESSDMFASPDGVGEDSNGQESGTDSREKAPNVVSPEAAALKGAVAGLRALHGKLFADLPFGKRETAWGKLDGKDLGEIFDLLREILVPLLGVSTITDIFERIGERRGWIKTTDHRDRTEAWEHLPIEKKMEEKRVWNEVMKTLHEPFATVTAAMDEGLEHVGVTLELLPKPKKKVGDDLEASDNNPKPGDKDFAKYMDQKMLDFYAKRGETLRQWAREKGLSQAEFDKANSRRAEPENFTPDEASHRRDQQQLYLILFMEHLLYETGSAISKLVKFSDSKVQDGTMKKNRLILPGQRRLKKWLLNFGQEDSALDAESPDSQEGGLNNVYMGSGFDARKDPEHLPPNSAWQHFGNAIRFIPRILGSKESAFGFRVACATLTVGIIAFLHDTQTFFTEQRLVWAMIIISIGMTLTSGQSIFGFFARIGGTAAAVAGSFIIWYIVDQKTPGVIVMLWFFIFLEMYLFLKFPRFLPAWIILIVTEILIVDYELQVRKLGVAVATSTGQPYYPIYLLAPYRLATVTGGSAVAFIWTFFPYPLTDRTWLRKDLGSTLYMLANYYSVVQSTIETRMHGTEGDMSKKTSPGRHLQSLRHKMFGKLLLLIPSLQQHADWQKWEPTIGGKFPRETYDAISRRCQLIMAYLSLMSFATHHICRNDRSHYPNNRVETKSQWLRDLTRLIDSIEPNRHSITSTLSLLSASVTQGSALPPYIALPQPYDLSRRLEALDDGILDSRHVEEPGYSAYAVLQVASSLVVDDLCRLVELVKDLVGETDFSLRVTTSDSSFDSNNSEGSTGFEKGKRE